MPKKVQSENKDDDCVPIPIQFFYWNQTSLFIKQKFGNLTEAHAMNFERVLAQNILHGLSPGLSDAINSISRWKFIKASFPHIIHATAASLTYRKEQTPSIKLNKAETKLLYTLHWLILDAASECEDNKGISSNKFNSTGHEITKNKSNNINIIFENDDFLKIKDSISKTSRGDMHDNYLHSIATIQLFVYMFAPVLNTLKPCDLDNLKLMNGLKIWEPLWSNRQPNILIFNTPVKCKSGDIQKFTNKANTKKKHKTEKANNALGLLTSDEVTNKEPKINFSEIYMGKKNEKTIEDLPHSSISDASLSRRENSIPKSRSWLEKSNNDDSILETAHPIKNTVSNLEVEKKQFKESSSDAPLLRRSKHEIRRSIRLSDLLVDTVGNDIISDDTVSACRAPLVHMSSLCSITDNLIQNEYSLINEHVKQSSMIVKPRNDEHKPHKYIHKVKECEHSENNTPMDIKHATYFDVAVLRCLLSSKWHIDGYLWALEYLFHRVNEIADEFLKEVNIATKMKNSSYPYLLDKINDQSFKKPFNNFIDILSLLETKHKHTSDSEEDFTHNKRRTQSNFNKRIRISETFRKMSSMFVSRRIKYIDEDLLPQKIFRRVNKYLINKKCNNTNDLKLKNLKNQYSNEVNDTKKYEFIFHKNCSFESLNSAIESDCRRGNLRKKSNYARSLSADEANIFYKDEYIDIEEAHGSKGFINMDGSLNLNIILKGAHSVTCKNNSAKLCELSFNIMDTLMNIDIMPTEEMDYQLDAIKSNLTFPQSLRNYIDEYDAKYTENYILAMDLILRNIKWLGCVHCQNNKTLINDQLRAKFKLLLNVLQEKNPKRFQMFLKSFVEKNDMNYILETIHALLGYCNDPFSGYSHYYPYLILHHSNSRNPNLPNENEKMLRLTKENINSIDNRIVDCILQPFVKRLLEIRKQLFSQENLYLFAEIRTFLGFVKDRHTSCFRKVAFICMLEPTLKIKNQLKKKEKRIKKLKITLDEQEAKLKKMKRNLDLQNDMNLNSHKLEGASLKIPNVIDDQDFTINESIDIGKKLQNTSLKNHNEKFSKIHINNCTEKKLLTPQTIDDTQDIDFNYRRASTASGQLFRKKSDNEIMVINVNGDKYTSSINLNEDNNHCALLPLEKRENSKKNKFNNSNGFSASASNLNDSENKSATASRSRLSFRVAGHAALSVLSAKKRIEQSLSKIGIVKRKDKRSKSAFDVWLNVENSTANLFEKKDSSNKKNGKDEIDVLQSSYEHNLGIKKKLENEKVLVDLNSIHKGIEYYRMLLECLPPGCIPDVPFMNTLLDLEAPIISKTALLLESAYFVNRCNRNDWPEWIKMNIGSYRPYGSFIGGRNNPNILKRNRIYQLASAHMFYCWGESLASKLESLMENDDGFDNSIGIFKKDPVNGMVDLSPEDFFNESTVNPDGKTCCYALKMVICVLLLEISAFIRETYQEIKKKNILNNNLNKPRDNRIQIGSLFSNESSTASLNNELGTGLDPSDQNGGLTSNYGNENEPSKHISFVFSINKDGESLVSSSSHTNIQIESTDQADTKHAQIKIIQQKRPSVKQNKQRASMKYRLDRNQRFLKRKTSQITGDHNDNDHSMNQTVDDDAGGLQSNNPLCENINEFFELDEIDTNKCFPWIKTVIKLLGKTNFECNHQICPANCYLKQSKSCRNLIEATLRMYEYSSNDLTSELNKDKNENKLNGGKERKASEISYASQRLNYFNSLFNNNIILKNSPNKNQGNSLLKIIETDPCIEYISNQVQNLHRIPMLILCKCALILSDEILLQLVGISWNLLLDLDQEISSSSATIFLIGSIKIPHATEKILQEQLNSTSVNLRYNAILKFDVLWKFRYYVWPHLENNAHNLLKISPPCIEFILPSPAIGTPFLQPVDPSWMPKAKTKVEEVTVNQEEVRAVVTASKSRKKHQQEILHRALQAEEQSKRIARENFPMTSLPYLHYASFEPILHQNREEEEILANKNEEHNNVLQVNNNITINRRLSVPPKRLQQRNSMLWSRKSYVVEGADEMEAMNTDILQSQPIFPASLGSVVVHLIDLLFDDELNVNLQSISTLTKRVVLNCLIEDTALFLRYFFEKITQKDKKNQIIRSLRLLLNVYIDIPPQTGYVIFNYLLGVVMYYVRSSCEGSQEAISSVLTLLWQIISNVNGIIYKDLKQTLRKEQCDPSILITAQVPSAKKIIVHGPDLSQIPTQLIVQEDTQFSSVMNDSFEFFGIPEAKREKHFLFDVKTSQIHLPDTYVRDFYFFRRNFYPQLTIVQMESKDAVKLLERTIQPSCFFSLLVAMEQNPIDPINILELVRLLDPAYPLMRSKNSSHYQNSTTPISLSNPSTNIANSNTNIINGNSLNTNHQNIANSSLNLLSTGNSAILMAAGINYPNALNINYINSQLNKHDNKYTMQPLDFCYNDECNSKFSIVNAINLCVTVVAYATHASRAYQMLLIIDVLIPRYLDYIKQQTDAKVFLQSSKNEYIIINKISIALKTMVHCADILTRSFGGPKLDGINSSYKNTKNISNRSASILPDEDSMRFTEEKRSKQDIEEKKEDRKLKQDFRLPRDAILNVVSEFLFSSTKRLKELSKIINDPSMKPVDVFDAKAHNKLSDIAHSLLKLWDDSTALKSRGLQNYFQKLLPVSDWSQESMKPVLSNLIRRIERIFQKMSKRNAVKKTLDWDSTAGILYGVYLTLDKQENIAQLPNFKLLVQSAIALILNENFSDANVTNSVGPITSFQLPVKFSKAIVKLVGRYLTIHKEQTNLEQLLGNTVSITQGGGNGLIYLIYFLLPLLFWCSSERKDTPKLNSCDIAFLITNLLSLLKPTSKVVPTLLLQVPKPHHFIAAFDTSMLNYNSFYNKSARQLKDIVCQSTFLGLKLMIFSFSESIEWAKVAVVIKQMCLKMKNHYVWKFLDFTCTYRTPLFLLLKPFIQNLISNQNCETEQDVQLRKRIQSSINGCSFTNNKCRDDILDELLSELNTIKHDLQVNSTPINNKKPKSFNNDAESSKDQRIPTRDEDNEDTKLSESSLPIKRVMIGDRLESPESFTLLNKAVITTKKCEKVDPMVGVRILDTYLRKSGLQLHDMKTESLQLGYTKNYRKTSEDVLSPLKPVVGSKFSNYSFISSKSLRAKPFNNKNETNNRKSFKLLENDLNLSNLTKTYSEIDPLIELLNK